MSQEFSQGSARWFFWLHLVSLVEVTLVFGYLFSLIEWVSNGWTSLESKMASVPCPMPWLESRSQLGLLPRALTPGCWTSSTVSQSSQRLYFKRQDTETTSFLRPGTGSWYSVSLPFTMRQGSHITFQDSRARGGNHRLNLSVKTVSKNLQPSLICHNYPGLLWL